MRLDKLLCEMGFGTRQEVKNIIKKGLVSINGTVVKKPETKVRMEDRKLVDTVVCKGQPVQYETYEYYMLNKPAGVVSATTDNLHKTVVELLPQGRKNLFPVGRLDVDTEGLLLITNDGTLAHNLLSPAKHVDKTYFVETDKPLDDQMQEAFLKGVRIHDRAKDEQMVTLRPAVLKVIDANHALVTIQEGKYHQVKRMFAAFGYKVVYLKRVAMGALKLDESLKAGAYRKLTEQELELLRKN